eukprot:766162-Rhodomonas_salina.1
MADGGQGVGPVAFGRRRSHASGRAGVRCHLAGTRGGRTTQRRGGAGDGVLAGAVGRRGP